MSQVAIAKGKDREDYLKNWSSTASIGKVALAGKDYKIEGSYLKKFKDAWKEAYGESLGKISSLIVGDWERTFAYLCQGSGETAKDFQSLGANAVETASRMQANNQQILPEAELQHQLQILTSYSNVRFRFESGAKGITQLNNGYSYVRFDWLEKLPKVVRLYELKNHAITESDVKSTLIDKGYPLIAAEFYSKPIELIFVSPCGICWEAEDYINDITKGSGQFKLGNVPITIKFQHLSDVADRVANNIIRTSPPEQWVWLQKKFSELQIVSSRSIAKLKNKIDGSYNSGKLRSSKAAYINSHNIVV